MPAEQRKINEKRPDGMSKQTDSDESEPEIISEGSFHIMEERYAKKGTPQNRANQKNRPAQVQGSTEKGRDKNGPKGSGAKKAALVTAAVLSGLTVSAAGAYTYMGLQYRDVFFPNTKINGLDASGKNVEQVKQMIDDGMDEYTLNLEERGGVTEQIGGEEIGLHSEYDGSLEQLLAGQEPMRWGLHWLEGSEHTIETMIVYDSDKLNQAVDGLDCMDESKTELPENAYLSQYQQGIGYEVIPEQGGTRVVPEKVRQGVADAITNLQDRVSLEELDAYEKARITKEDPALNAQAEEWNKYVNVTVTYQFGNQTQVLDGDTIHTWMTEDDQGGLILDEDKVAEYVAELAKNYDTAYQPKTLRTAYGSTVTITGGNYGWRINRKAEAAALSEIIRSGKSQEREPVYSQTAASRGERDYGNTYVEINLTAQHLYFYKNGELLVESDFVSGNESRGMSTPAGAFPLTYKQRNATLRGEGYATPVSYWMPFNGGIGMHDAGWRGSFGGKIYKTNGSHGCINLPPSVAKTIYENITSGIPVLCYHLDGTNKGTTSSPPKSASVAPTAPTSAPPPTPETAPLPVESETVLETLPAETAPQETGPVEGGPSSGETNPVGPGFTEAPAGPGETAPNPPQPENPPAPSEPAPVETPAAPAPDMSGGPGVVDTPAPAPVGPGV